MRTATGPWRAKAVELLSGSFNFKQAGDVAFWPLATDIAAQANFRFRG